MKFLQEMIAKKRASQHELEGEDYADHEDMEDDMASHDGFEDEMEASDGFEMEAEEAYEEEFEDDVDVEDDDSDLFEDESYDWEFEGAETADLSDDAGSADTMHAPEDNDYDDDDDDIDVGVANVLREVAGKTQAPEMPEPGEPAVASRLEENVEKLRIQRKIWDLEADDDGVEAAAEPVDEDEIPTEDSYAEAEAESDVEAEADFEDDMFDNEFDDVAMDDTVAEGDPFADQPDATFEDAAGDTHEIDFDSEAGSAAAMAALRAQNPRIQSKSELRREPAPRREQAQMPRMAAADPGNEAQGDAMRPRAGRVKTRLLGFNRPEDKPADPFAKAAPAKTPEPHMDVPSADPQFPVGWLIVLEGPGRGASFTLSAGVSQIGRGHDQAIRLDYGDTSISRDNHAAIAYDEEKRTFFIGHGGKANLVRLNDMPVLSTETLTHDDLIRIGETTLRFIALCGPEFSWDTEGEAGSPHEAAE